MRKYPLISCGFVWLIGIFSPLLIVPTFTQDYETIRKQSEGSVVHIHSRRRKKDGTGSDENSYGTGFIVTKSGHVLTNSHVVLKPDDQTIVETTAAIRTKQGQRYKLESVKRDDDVDLMLLVLPDVSIDWKPLTFGNSEIASNDAPLYVLGFPGDSDLSSATGILSNKSGPNGTWQTTLPINRGNSGGPVFDKNGKVIAIAKAGHDMSQLVTYVIPVNYVSFVTPKSVQLTIDTENSRPISTNKFDVSEEFSTTTNPRGAWCYGYLSPGVPPNPGTFQYFRHHGSYYDYFASTAIEGLYAWRIPLPARTDKGSDLGLVVLKNMTDRRIRLFAPGQVALHPGFGGYYSAIRWTAVASVTYSVTVEFTGLDPKPTTTDVYVFHNYKKLYYDDIVDHQRPHQFSAKLPIAKGDTVDFIVGCGKDKEIWNDTTGLRVEIFRLDN